MSKQKPVFEPDFDFGFATVGEDELKVQEKVLQDTVTQTAELHAEAQERFDKLYAMIMPLLKNLKSNPEKAYIHWPDRVAKIDAFIEKIETLKE